MRLFFPLVCGAICLFIGMSLAGEGAAGQGQGRWFTDYALAREQARATGKPIFLVFRCEH